MYGFGDVGQLEVRFGRVSPQRNDEQPNKERQSYSANGPWKAEMSNIAHNLIANYRFVLNFRTNIWIKLGDFQSQLNSCFVSVGPIKNAYHYDLRCCSSTLCSSPLVAHTFFISRYQQRHIAWPCTTFLQDMPAV